jgi:hypothetical protein
LLATLLVTTLLLTTVATLLLSAVATLLLLATIAALLLLATVAASAASESSSSSAASKAASSALWLGASWLTLSEDQLSLVDDESLGVGECLLAIFWAGELDESESSWPSGFSVGRDFDVDRVFELVDLEEIINSGVP